MSERRSDNLGFSNRVEIEDSCWLAIIGYYFDVYLFHPTEGNIITIIWLFYSATTKHTKSKMTELLDLFSLSGGSGESEESSFINLYLLGL